MRIEVDPQGFNELNTAILYSEEGSKIMWRGSSEGLLLTDLLEYNLEFNIKKDTFATSITPNLYSLPVRDTLGNRGIIEHIDSFAPSSFPNDESTEYWYGSATLNDKTIIILPASSGVHKVELFEKFLKEEEKDSPNMTIYLGESSSDRVTQKEREKLREEITADKAIVIAMSQIENVSPEVNLAYKSFQLSPNPLRNMERLYLRNDRFNSIKKDLKIIKNIGDDKNPLVIDTRSGTLLGTRAQQQIFTPIFARKLERINARTNNRTNYSFYRCYEEGETVDHNGTTWISLCAGNIGNVPGLSPGKWSILKNLSTIFTDRVLISSESGGFVTPSGYITVQRATEDHVFDVSENLGYKLSPTDPVYTSSGVKIKNFKITESIGENNELTKKISVTSWSDAIDSGKIIFHFIEEGCAITLRLQYNGREYNANTWNEFIASMSSSDILKQLTIFDGKTYHRSFYVSEEGEAIIDDIPINQNIVFSFPYLGDFQPEELIVTSSVGGENNEMIIPPTFTGTYDFPMVSNFSSASFLLKMIAKQLEIIATGAGFEFDKPKGEVSYNSTTPYILSFYCLDESLQYTDWKVTVNGLEITLDGSPLTFDNSATRVTYTRGGMEEGVYQLTWIGQFKQSYTVTISKK